jgi:hypothetical protein
MGGWGVDILEKRDSFKKLDFHFSFMSRFISQKKVFIIVHNHNRSYCNGGMELLSSMVHNSKQQYLKKKQLIGGNRKKTRRNSILIKP